MNTGEREQRIEIGTDVVGSDGEKLGTVAYVVVRPPEMHVTDFVVSTGAILGRDVVVPVSAVTGVADGEVHLSMDKDEVNRCEDYVEVRYERPPEDWIAPTGLAYPSQTMLWPAGVNMPEPSSVEVNAPPGTVGLHEGMDVESSDGHRVGSIEALDQDAATGNITAIIVKQGHLFTHDTRIPIESVAGVENDKVTLTVPRDALGEA